MNPFKSIAHKILQREIAAEQAKQDAQAAVYESLDKIPPHRNESIRINFPIGSKVICRSNEDEPYLVAHVHHYEDFGKDTLIPVVIDDNNKLWNIMGVMHPWTQGKIDALNKLTPLEQWNIMAVFGSK